MEKDASTKAINTELKELTTSIFAQYSQRLGVFRAVVAGSYDFIEPLNIDFKDGQGDVKDKQPELDDGYSLQGVLYYDISSAQSVHFTLGKKNNLPTLKQRYSSLWGAQVKSPGLDIENAINYELGYDLALGNTNLSVAVFYNDMKNMFVQKTLIQTTDEDAAKAVCAVPEKIGETTHFLATKMSMQTAATLGAVKWAWSRAFLLMIC